MKIQINSLYLALCLSLSTAAVVATFTGCAGNRYNRSTGEYIDDKSLRLRVDSALGDNPDYKFEDVNVAAFKGTVQLSGFVGTADQKAEAADITRRVEGVKGVVNNITVNHQSENNSRYDDKSMTSRVSRSLRDNPDYKFDEVKVTTLNGIVQLSGFVDTSDQKTQAGDIARQVYGVKDVVNNITVKD